MAGGNGLTDVHVHAYAYVHVDEDNAEAARTLYQQARAAMAAGDRSAAISQFTESAQLQPHFKTYELLGECLLAEGQVTQAILYLSAAVGLGRKTFRAHYLLATALLELGAPEDAREQLIIALELQPNYSSAERLLEQLRG